MMIQPLTFGFRLEILILVFAGWLIMYFIVNRRQAIADEHMVMGSDYDRAIPYIPLFALVYFSTYIFVIQPFFVISNPRQFNVMVISFAVISLLYSTFHAIVPSKVERIENVKQDGISGRMLDVFQGICQPYGNFPSLHVGLSVPVVMANYLVFGLKGGLIALFCAILIAVSTLFTKQHYIMDVLAGFMGGLLIYGLISFLI
ncbi:MAG: phosphatase PAP2 family protein [Chloroflexota bacterium]